ncbi:ATP-dependent transcriptional regulator [Hahella chejuensis KCTC 2396]|uniref:ATP-dependent transcriptional regulator n=2 Tax=Hahella chejuensis TaxID=158327 RepID=Q2SIT0_HAHCH|nr:ATP-dependent transcriptional regulator [Hahella chejuensis KCTC 2396]
MIVLETKLFPLRLDDSLLTRQRLLRRIGAPGSARFIGLVAPAGFGKSTLARQWTQSHHALTSWISLDPADNSASTFWGYVVEGLRRNGLEDVAELRARLQETAHANARVLVTALINQLHLHQDRHFVLVLDDLHHIANKDILDGLTYLVDFAPANFTLIVTSRNEPSFPLARWKVKRYARLLYSADLVFDSREVADLFALALDVKVSPEAAARVVGSTGGWAAALQLLSQADLKRADGALSNEKFEQALAQAKKEIDDYVAQEVLDDLPTHLREFILEMAGAARFDVALCDLVRGAHDSHQILQELAARNLFLIPLDDAGQWFRFHELFRDGALHYLRQRQPNVHLQHCRQVVQASLERRLYLESVQLIMHIQAWDLLQSTLENIGNQLVRQGYHLYIIEWLNDAPQELLNQSLRLQLLKIWCLLYDNQFAAIPDLVEAAKKHPLLPEQDDTVRHELRLLEAYAARSRKDIQTASALTQSVLQDLQQINAPIKSLAYFGLGNDYYGLGRLDDAMAALKEAVTLGKLEQRFSTVLSSLGLLLWIMQIKGDFLHAINLFRQTELWVQSYHKDGPEPNIVSCWLNSSLVLIHCALNNPEHAERFLKPMLPFVDNAEPQQKLITYYTWAEFNRHCGDYSQALRHYEQAREQLEHNQRELAAFAPPVMAGKLHCLLDKGDMLHAESVYAQILSKITTETSPFEGMENLSAQARYFLHKQQWPNLQETSELIQALAESHNSSRYQAQAKLLHAAALAGQNQPEAARRLLSEALALGESNDFVAMFLADEACLKPLYANLNVAETSQAYLEKLQINPLPQKPAPAQEEATLSQPGGLLEELSKREMEVLTLIYEGLPNKKIADRLFLAPATVKAHIRNIYGKIGAASRTEALARARHLGLL